MSTMMEELVITTTDETHESPCERSSITCPNVALFKIEFKEVDPQGTRWPYMAKCACGDEKPILNYCLTCKDAYLSEHNKGHATCWMCLGLCKIVKITPLRG